MLETTMPSSDDTAEIRGQFPRHLVDMLDAVSLAQNRDRKDLLTQILIEYYAQRMREHLAVERVLKNRVE